MESCAGSWRNMVKPNPLAPAVLVAVYHKYWAIWVDGIGFTRVIIRNFSLDPQLLCATSAMVLPS